MGCMVTQWFNAGGNQEYLEFWVIIGDPRYLGYETLMVSLEHSIEQVAKVGHSTGGRIGTHMLLWVPP
jgi:hypothetical protein